MLLSLDQLRVLRAIDEHRSIAAAARSLHLSQPTLSHHLAAFEAVVGGRLVTRTARGSHLTELGALALSHARMILDRVDAAEREIHAHVKHGASVLEVGTFPSAGAALLAMPLARLEQTGAAHRLTIAEPVDVAQQLRERHLHVAILETEPEIPFALGEDVRVTRLFDDPFVVLLAPSHRCAHRRVIELEALADDVWISAALDEDPAHRLLMQAYLELGIEPRIGARLDDFAVTEALVAAGLGVSLRSTIGLHLLAEGVVARPLADTRFRRELHVGWVTRPERPAAEFLSAEIQRFAADWTLPRWD